MGRWQHRPDYAAHRRARKAALARLVPGQKCPRCGGPMVRGMRLALDHRDDGRPGYWGLAHAVCNSRAGGKLAQARRKAARGAQPPPRPRPRPPRVDGWIW